MNTPLRDLGRHAAQLDMQKGAEEYGRLVHHILRHRGNFSAARVAAKENRLQDVRGLTTRLVDILKALPPEREISQETIRKAAASAGSLAGSALLDAGIITSGWINSLASYGVFDRMLGDMVQIPLQPGTVGAPSIGAQSYSVAEGSMKPTGRLTLTGAATNISKVHVALIVTLCLAAF